MGSALCHQSRASSKREAPLRLLGARLLRTPRLIDSYLYLYPWHLCPLAAACDFADPPAWVAAGWDAASKVVSSQEAVWVKSRAGWRSGRQA